MAKIEKINEENKKTLRNRLMTYGSCVGFDSDASDYEEYQVKKKVKKLRQTRRKITAHLMDSLDAQHVDVSIIKGSRRRNVCSIKKRYQKITLSSGK